MSKIFIPIAAFNEIHLKQTIKSLLDNKSLDNEIIINLCDFRTKDNFDIFLYKEVRHNKYNVSIPPGVGLCRHMAMNGFEDSDYVFQIDAHMTFGKNWDQELIKRHLLLEQLEGECLISQHLPALSDKNDGEMSIYQGDKYLNSPVSLFINKAFKIWSTPWAATKEKWYMENTAVHAAFMFGKSITFAKIPPDPLMFFFGEEHTLYMRMYTRGIKSFSTDYFDMRHLNKEESFYNDLEKKDWRTFAYENADKNIKLFDIFSNKRFKAILNGEILGLWGAPTYNLCIEALEKMNIKNHEFLKI